MQPPALGHRLETLHDGVTNFCNGEPMPMPLAATAISVRVVSGLAFVRTTRRFRNAEAHPIEAVMTFPVGFDAVVTGLTATIDGRRFTGVAKERAEARETYEAALDRGRLSVLPEEALRGIHILSVGALPPGAEVSVDLDQTVALADVGGAPFLRLPMTTGQLYGTSPLLPSDDLVTADVRHVASLSVTVDAGHALLNGRMLAPDETPEILLDRALELRIEGGSFGKLTGTAADGSTVHLSLEALGSGDLALDLHVIVDRSGSTKSPVRDGEVSVWQAMRNGLAAELATLRAEDRLTMWQFDNDCQRLGAARGPSSAKLVDRLDGPRGGTELARAIRAALDAGARDILVLTDGQTWAHIVEDLKGAGARISAILAGPRSLDANIGHLCALTGGQLFYAPGRDVASALRSAFAALRQVGAAVQGKVADTGPRSVTAHKCGVRLRAEWSAEDHKAVTDAAAIGRFAAALALPLLPAEQAEALARAHSLCTHMTSLVLVDDVGEATEGFSRMRKVPLMAGLASGSPFVARKQYLHLPAPDLCVQAGNSTGRPSPETHSRLRRVVVAPEKARLGFGPKNKPSPKGVLKRLVQWFSRDEQVSDLAMFEGFAWDAHGDELLAGNFSLLSNEQRAAVQRLARRVQSACYGAGDQSSTIGDVHILALGLIARCSEGRAAERFARRVLKGAPPWLLEIA